jgi:hypothetical protein
VQNEKLCWTRYKWAARSNETIVLGQIGLNYYPTRDEVCRTALERAAAFAIEDDSTWDPFNCTVVVIRHRNVFTKEDIT